MVVDSSAVIAWIRAEDEADAIRTAIVEAPSLLMSAFNVFETKTVLARRFPSLGVKEFDVLIESLDIRVLPFDADQAGIAFDAYLRFGKGSGHSAQLNLGDCAAYALARSRNLPLLFKGEDFIHTDVKAAL
jgi:ribonuclease VapC